MPQEPNLLQSLIDNANKGDADAQFWLGTMYYDGKGVPQDYKEAVKWFTMAAEQGHAYAQLYLGRIHYNGDGVPQDYTEAYKWVLLAQMNGEDVSKLKQDLTAKMTPVQIAEAQKLAKEFGAKNNNAKNGGTIIEPNSSEDVNKDALRVERLRDKIQKAKDSEDKTKDALRVKRLRDKIQKMKDAIELAETQILNLPRLQPNQRGYLEEALAVTERKHTLLYKEEENYNQIIRLAEKYHDLGVDVMAMKKLLIKCEGRIDDVKLDKERLLKSINQQNRR
jgi:TPR repeat protein